MDLFNTTGAEFSEDRVYRYALWRIWSPELPKLMIVGLNPSTADANLDDPTIRRGIGFAKAFGKGGLYMTNLFAFRATNPEEMKKATYPIGLMNDFWIKHTAKKCDLIIFAWGNNGQHLSRDIEVKNFFPEAMCFGKTLDGHPKHPLYLPKNTNLIKFNK